MLTLPDNVSHVHGRVLSNCAFHRDRVGSARAYHCSWGGIAGAHRWFVFSCKLHVVRCPRVASSAWRIHTTELREALASVSMPARGYEDPYWLPLFFRFMPTCGCGGRKDCFYGVRESIHLTGQGVNRVSA